jgi:NAD(P)-dependent dehydrogenase (short-subunit alcohol dehydrogenase family)
MTVVVGSPELAAQLEAVHIEIDANLPDALQDAAYAAVVCCLPAPDPEPPFTEVSSSEFDRRVETQLGLAVRVGRAAIAELMVSGHGGNVIFVAAQDGGAIHASALTGLLALSRSIVKEYSRYRIRSNVVTVSGSPSNALSTLRFLLSDDSLAVAGERIEIGLRNRD